MNRRFSALVVVLAAAAAGGLALAPLTLPERGLPGQSAPFDRKVRDYLVSNPEVIMEAVAVLERRKGEVQTARRREILKERSGVIRSPRGLPVKGNAEGDVTVVEFFDYRCPYCKRSAPEVEALLKGDGDVRVVLKEFPILGPQSVFAARAAIGANAQGKYLAFHDALMAHGGEFSEEDVMTLARGVGLDVDRLRADMAKPAVDAMIRENLALARDLGIRGTPAFIIGDNLVPGYAARANLAALVARARDGCETC